MWIKILLVTVPALQVIREIIGLYRDSREHDDE